MIIKQPAEILCRESLPASILAKYGGLIFFRIQIRSIQAEDDTFLVKNGPTKVPRYVDNPSIIAIVLPIN